MSDYSRVYSGKLHRHSINKTNDYISRHIDADENLYTIYKENWTSNTGVEKQGVWEDVINKIPPADVVEVVRCADCKHFEAINNDDHGWCKMISDLPCGISVRYDDDYCSYGERAEA